MTLEELEATLPWGLHDAYLERIEIDWPKAKLVLDVRVMITEHQDMDQRARVTVKHAVRAGDQITGEGEFIVEPRIEVADLYKAAKLKVVSRREAGPPPGPPWLDVPPALEVYRARGHRRLATTTFNGKCSTCMWACEMAVELTIDQPITPAARHAHLHRTANAG